MSADGAPGEARRRGSLSDSVTEALLSQILGERLEPGSALPSENQLSERLGISRGIVREAVRGLVSLGIVETGNGRLPRVRRVDGDVLALITEVAVRTEQVTIQQTLDARRAIETRTAELAALHRTEREARDIAERALALAAARGDLGAMTRADIDFHVAVAGASRNPFLRLQVEGFRLVTERTGPVGWRCRRNEAQVTRQIEVHGEIGEAIARGDAPGAAEAMSRHFTDTIAALAQAGFN